MDMRFGTWNVRSMYRADSFMTVSKEIRPLGKLSHRWESGIKMDLRETGCCDIDCIDLDQGRDKWRAPVKTVMNLRVP
jgi:hypothetical protein